MSVGWGQHKGAMMLSRLCQVASRRSQSRAAVAGPQPLGTEDADEESTAGPARMRSTFCGLESLVQMFSQINNEVSGAKMCLRHRAAGLHVRCGTLGKGCWVQGTGAKVIEAGSAAVAEPTRTGKKEASSASIAVAIEEVAAVGGNSLAASEDRVGIKSCMFMKVQGWPQMHNRSCGHR